MAAARRRGCAPCTSEAMIRSKRVVGERQAQAVAADRSAAAAGRRPRPPPPWRRTASRHVLQLGVVEVEGHDAGARGGRPRRRGGRRPRPCRAGGRPARGRGGRSRRSASALAVARARQAGAVLLDGAARRCGASVQCSMTRLPARPRRRWRRRSGSSECRGDAGGQGLASPGGTRKAVSPSAPTTSGMAPPVVATRGTPQHMASIAGSEKPS